MTLKESTASGTFMLPSLLNVLDVLLLSDGSVLTGSALGPRHISVKRTFSELQ